MQSETFVDGHCVRRTKLPRNGNARRDSDDVSVWELAGLLLASRFELCVEIRASVARFIFDITSNLPHCGSSERVPSLSEVLQEILCMITASQIQTKDGVRQSVTFVDGHCVRHTVTRIHHEARRPSRNVQDKLARHVHGVHVENLEHDLRHALSVSLEVQRNFREQNGILFIRNPEFVVERVMQDFLHVVPIRDDTKDAQYLYPALGRRHRNHHGGACDPGGRPQGLAPRSPRHEGGNTHLSKNTCHLSAGLSGA